MSTALLGLALLVDGHHALPLQPDAAACRRSASALQQTLMRDARRPQRQRALLLLWRCSSPLPLVALRGDADPELRLSAWRLTLDGLALSHPRWQQALAALPQPQRRSLLAWQRRLRASSSGPTLDRTLP